MSFDWSEFLGLAQSLIGDSETQVHGAEAKFRAAVSRAYYAAHGMAGEKLKSEGQRLPDQGVHKAVINKFKRSPDLTRQCIASELDMLSKKRVKADYDAAARIDQATAQYANRVAYSVIQRINTL